MASCPNCHSNISEGFQFCTHCGAALSPTAAPAKAKSRDPAPAAPTALECRFCRNPLAPDGEFCETCGAPVEEAAPPGFVKPKPKPTPAPPENLSTAPAPAPSIPDAKPKASGQVSPGPRKKERARQRARSDAPARVAPPSPPKPKRQASPPVRRTATPPPQPATTRKSGKPANWVSSALSLLLVVVAVGATAWYLHRSTSETPDTGTDLLTPAASPQSAPPTPSSPAREPRAGNRGNSPRSTPKPAAAKPRPMRISRLASLAAAAYSERKYAEPVDASAIAYSKQVLARDANNENAKSILENSVQGGIYQSQQALKQRDFRTARRVANALSELLPGRSDIDALKQDIMIAESAESGQGPLEAARVRYRVYHLHSEKAPANDGPYCLGILSIAGGHLKFAAESTSDAELHTIEFACSEVRNIRKNRRLASRQGGFHVRTRSANYNFAPENSSVAPVPGLQNACSL